MRYIRFSPILLQKYFGGLRQAIRQTSSKILIQQTPVIGTGLLDFETRETEF
jgi:hypothetical protein